MLFQKLFNHLYSKYWKKIERKDIKRIKSQNIPSYVKLKVFNTLKDDTQISFNLYYQKELNDKLPTLINIHGGGWSIGNKDTNQLYNSYFSKDFNVISLDYPNSESKSLKNTLDYIDFFVDYLVYNSELNINKSNIFLSGDSSGGQIIFMLVSIYENPLLLKKFNYKYKKIKGLLLNHSVPYLSYISDQIDSPFKKILQKYIFNMLIKKDKDYFNKVDPNVLLNHAFPPMVIISSSGDEAFYFQSKRLADDLKERNINYLFLDIKDSSKKHVFNVINPSDKASIMVNDEAIKYLLDSLKPQEERMYELAPITHEITLKN